MRLFFLALLIAAVAGGVHGASLGGQLELATAEKDPHAQIELIRRILDNESDEVLRRRLVSLWLEVADYEMAEMALKEWKAAPPGFYAIVAAEILVGRDRNRKDAIALLEAYHKKDPADRDVTLRLVEALSTEGNATRIDEVLSGTPGIADDGELRLRRAQARRTFGDLAGALEDFSAADQIDSEIGTDQRPSFDRIRASLPEFRATTAVLADHPDDFVARVTRAQLYREAGAGSGLIAADAKAALTRVPDSVAATLLYVAATQTSEQALKDFSVDLGKSPPTREALRSLAELDVSIAKNPRDAEALAARSFLLNDTPAQYLLGLRDAESALKVDPTLAEAHLEGVYALIELNRTAEAKKQIETMRRAKAPAAQMANAYGYLAKDELESYRLNSALDYATKSLEYEPSSKRYATRAAILQRLNRAAEAREDLGRAKALGKKP